MGLAVLATDVGLPWLGDAMRAMHGTVIAVPPFEQRYLERGHAVHFNVPDTTEVLPAAPLRVDVMSRMRGVAEFDELWERRTTVALPGAANDAGALVDVMSQGDLVTAKKTQRDKDWPMIRRLVDASYDTARTGTPSDAL